MGGGDKSLLPLSDRPVLAEVVDRLAPQVGPLVLSANGDPGRFAAFGLPVVPDTLEGFHGPLAGIEAGLSWVRAECPGVAFAVTVPGDTPFIPADLVTRLADGKGTAAMAVAVSAVGLHPVVGLWPVGIADALADALARGERRASQFVREEGAAEVSFAPVSIAGSEVDPFFNINTSEDLDYARDLAARA
ncbi:hypothetical protein AUC70_12910 [Methyloceanibacter stevinii]|uniref:Molybdenum cofactor guanylyltransferase n=1 Tax=Methyloceanibacter stevinii TaxID=1774970 RepID=A0A1E3VUF6_9HYPH|nr:hypothetical protein AUC70_12910 [Methyloceanibacter stevinii]